MEKLHFECIDDLADEMIKKAIEGHIVYSALFYDDAAELLRSLLDYEAVQVGYLDMDVEYSDNKEYYVVLDNEFNVSIEKAWVGKSECHEPGYKYFEADDLYLDGAVSYAIVKRQGRTTCNVYEIEFLDHCDSRCCEDHDDCEATEKIDFFKQMLNFLEYLFSDDEDSTSESVDHGEVEEFIGRRFKDAAKWIDGNCYYFAVILKDRFPSGDIYYDVINGHFVYKFADRYYDHTGVIEPDGYLVKWDTFDDYDSIQKQRIVRDCIK